eukprot:CAMPEP_0181059322 /NCGR_PEP_ID=MMETSP1070-20121207/21318_1 /TAXON_ID=265543 /ORGANISM="Minutocellus polymorphus, Strain NH13" /LENGTH=286 /DNA_ID=CAMNT_0023138987 /DNA_START=89 /DNA_END=946 /DNA_ORIENTATION=+
MVGAGPETASASAEHDHQSSSSLQEEEQPTEPLVLDSLPYIDYSHPDYEAYAASLIEEEMATFRPHPDTVSLPHLGRNVLAEDPRFGRNTASSSAAGGDAQSTPPSINEREYAALVARGGAPRPEGGAYAPSTTHSTDLPPLVADTDDVSLSPDHLRQSIDRAKVALEHHRSRLTNLELQSEFESAAWTHGNATAERGPVAALSDGFTVQRARVDEVNARRKTMQEEEAAPRLNRLGARWEELVGNNLKLSEATRLLQEEVASLREEAGETEEVVVKAAEGEDSGR